jgi:hypothetical protein
MEKEQIKLTGEGAVIKRRKRITKGNRQKK